MTNIEAFYRYSMIRRQSTLAAYARLMSNTHIAVGAGDSSPAQPEPPTPPTPPPVNDKLKLVVETTADYNKSGIYSAERDDASKPVVIDWGDGTVEQVDGDINQKVHEYTSAGTFNVTINNIKSYAASMSYSDWYNVISQNRYTLKEVVAIPNSVTRIGDYAFSNCNSLTSVTIPSSVTSIQNNAFNDCTGLTNMTIPDAIESIGPYAFYNCNGLTSMTIGNSVTSIGNYAFDSCNGLTSVTIPDSVTNIGDYAFSSNKLTCVYITDIVKWCNICGGKAFHQAYDLYLNDEKITMLTIPSSVINISAETFQYCVSLENMTILDGVTSIGNYAFYNCYNLKSVIIPDSVTRIGRHAFPYCSGLMSFTVDDGNANYKSVNGLLLSKDGKSLIKGVNGDVTIPESVTSIEQQAFYGYSSLENLSFAGDNVPSGGFECFYDIANLIDIYMLNVSQSEVMSQLDSNIKDWGLGICHIDGAITYYPVTIHCKDDEIVTIDPTPSGSGS